MRKPPGRLDEVLERYTLKGLRLELWPIKPDEENASPAAKNPNRKEVFDLSRAQDLPAMWWPKNGYLSWTGCLFRASRTPGKTNGSELT